MVDLWFTQTPESILTKTLGHSGTTHEVFEACKELEKDIKIAYYLASIPVESKSLKYFLKRQTVPADYLTAFLKYQSKIPSGYEEEALAQLKEVLFINFEDLSLIEYEKYKYEGWPFFSIVRKKGEHILDEFLSSLPKGTEGLPEIITNVLTTYKKQVEEYKVNKKVLAFLVSKALELADGKFPPKQIAEKLKEGLGT